MAGNETAKPEDPKVKSRADSDAHGIQGSSDQTTAYHDAYTKFANELNGNSNLNAQQRTDQLAQYRKDMGQSLGTSASALELNWASQHMDKFPHQMEGGAAHRHDTGNINGDNLKDFKSTNQNAGEAAFENRVAQELYTRYNNSEFSSFRHNITKDDLTSRVSALDKDAGAQGKVMPEATLLASAAGKDTSGKDVSLFDRISADGKYVDMSRNGKLAQLAGMVDQGAKPDWMTDAQAKEVQKLHNYAKDPLNSPDAKDVRALEKGDVAISKTSLEAATGQSFDSLREMSRSGDKFTPSKSIDQENRDKDQAKLKGEDDGIAAQNAKEQAQLKDSPYMKALTDKTADGKGTVYDYVDKKYGDGKGNLTQEALQKSLGDANIKPEDRDRITQLVNNWDRPQNAGSLNDKDAAQAAAILRGSHHQNHAETDAKEMQIMQMQGQEGGMPMGSMGMNKLGDYTDPGSGISKQTMDAINGAQAAAPPEQARPAERPTPGERPQPAEQPTPEQIKAQNQKDAASLTGHLQAGDVPLGDLGMKGPNDPIQKGNLDAKLNELRQKGAVNWSDADKKEADALGTLQKHWDDIAGEKGRTTIKPDDINKWTSANGSEFKGFKPDGPTPEQQKQAELGKQLADQRDKDSEPYLKDQHLGKGPIIDQAKHLLADRYKELGLQMPKTEAEQNKAAREYLHRLGDANGWHVTPDQWKKYEDSGNPRELPKTLNQELDARKPLKQPGLSGDELQAMNAKVTQGQVTEDGINKIRQSLPQDQRTALDNKISEAYMAAHPGQSVTPDKVGAAAMQLAKEQGDKAPNEVKQLLGAAQQQDGAEKQQALAAEDQRRADAAKAEEAHQADAAKAKEAAKAEGQEFKKAFHGISDADGGTVLGSLFKGAGDDPNDYRMTAETVKATLIDGNITKLLNDQEKAYLTQLQAKLEQSGGSMGFGDFGSK